MDNNTNIGYQVLAKRHTVVMRIFEVLNAHLSEVEKVQAVGEALRELVPFDRFGLGLLWLNRWYVLTAEGLEKVDIQRTDVMPKNFSASKWVVQNREVLLRPSIADDQRFIYDQQLLAEGLKSDLAIPLVVEDAVVGTFNFLSKEEHAYDAVALEMATSVASGVAAVVKLFQDQLFLEGVREISEAVQGSLDLDQVLQMILEHIQSQGYDRVRVYLFEEAANELVGVAQAGGVLRKPFQHLRLPITSDTFPKISSLDHRAYVYKNGELKPYLRRLLDEVFEGFEFKEKADLPLFVIENGKDRIIGKITLDNGLSDRPLLQDRLDALMVYASQAAIAIRHAQLYKRLENEVEDRTAQLRESEERFRRLSEASFEGVVISEQGIVVDVNQQYCQMLGYEREELLNEPVLRYVAPQFQERVRKYIEMNYEDPYESSMVCKDGSMFPIEVRARTVPQEGRMIRVSAIRDLSDRKIMEQEQIRLERVNAIGELAQGVAHNFNNILVGILGNAQLIQLRTQDAEVLEDAKLIVESSLRAKELVQRLQVSIQGDQDYALEVDVNSAIQAAIDLTRPRWKDESEANGILIDVQLHLNDVQYIWGIWERLRDLVVNLVLNAVEAMPDGGTLKVETQMVDDLVQIVFSDTGVGMRDDIRRRVFEPFFTTKHNVGSGLGLSIVQGTIKSWGGSVVVDSVEGKGTKFVMDLPTYKSVTENS